MLFCPGNYLNIHFNIFVNIQATVCLIKQTKQSCLCPEWRHKNKGKIKTFRINMTVIQVFWEMPLPKCLKATAVEGCQSSTKQCCKIFFVNKVSTHPKYADIQSTPQRGRTTFQHFAAFKRPFSVSVTGLIVLFFVREKSPEDLLVPGGGSVAPPRGPERHEHPFLLHQ